MVYKGSAGRISDEDKTLKQRYSVSLGDASLKESFPYDDLLPDAFAVVRESATRVLNMRHFHVQILGGIVLHQGRIAEMKTGEGKTLVATLAAYLNAIEQKGVHIVTVNDYLAKRDAEWMGQVYRFLGLTVDYIVHEKDDIQRKEAYNADITYATNNELGFDYLRDNMKFSLEERVQRDFNFAIVDEVDSILIDEARTPLIISGAAEDSSEKYILVNNVIKDINRADYEKDEKAKNVTLTEVGMEHVEKLLKDAGLIKEGGLYDIKNVPLVNHVNQALRANVMFTKDVDYLVRDNQVLIIDEFTGRIMEGRRYSDGLHQALEAKEHVEIQSENQTLASITFQNYFRIYPKLAGMTGTAMTEEAEFCDIYNLSCVEIPTNRPILRMDEHDCIYRTEKEKYKAILDTIKECNAKGQPVLVGTTSVEKSEIIATLLKQQTNISFEVLNAKHHEREAAIVAEAGRFGAVTIATNMAGRGTDIQLGGNPDLTLKKRLTGTETEEEIAKIKEEVNSEIAENKAKVLSAGGLYILGTERHESRRIDNQLRGRSGRQGDPGHSKFFLSLEDDLLRIFGSDKLGTMLGRLGLNEEEAIVHPWISKSVEKAQKKVENAHYEMRKTVLKYDDVVNEQRLIIFEQRKDIINANSDTDFVEAILLDLNMPGVDGFGVLEYMRQNNLLKKMPVSIISGDSSKDTIDRAFTYEIVDMVAKPFNDKNIKSVVEKTIFYVKVPSSSVTAGAAVTITITGSNSSTYPSILRYKGTSYVDSTQKLIVPTKVSISRTTNYNYNLTVPDLTQHMIKVIKVDEYGKPLANVKFEIYDKNNTVVDTLVTDAQGKAQSKQLPLGEYTFKEVEVPDGIVLDSTVRPFALTVNNQVITKTIVNVYFYHNYILLPVVCMHQPVGIKF